MSELARKVGLPPKPFLYTIDQVMVLVGMTSERNFRKYYVHFDGKSIGPRPRSKLMARNIAPPGRQVEWRIAERELIRWLRFHNFHYLESTGRIQF